MHEFETVDWNSVPPNLCEAFVTLGGSRIQSWRDLVKDVFVLGLY